MSFKDLYKTLGLHPSASLPEIKKAYHRLALLYHPDKNKEGHFGDTIFKDIQEAYSVLGNEEKKRKYDEQRWLNGLGTTIGQQKMVTPEWLLTVCVRLNAELKLMDKNSISSQALQNYIYLILSQPHIDLLQKENNRELTRSIIKEIIQATFFLPFSKMLGITETLRLLEPDNQELTELIERKSKIIKKEELSQKLMPLFIMLVTILLCLFIYYYSNWK